MSQFHFILFLYPMVTYAKYILLHLHKFNFNGMKNHISLILSTITLLILISFTSCNKKAEHNNISISGAFALYPLTVKWAEEYQKIHPEITIDVSAGGAGKGMTDVLSGMVDLAMFSRTISGEETSKGAWSVAVARDAVVPTINAANPYVESITAQGITQLQFKGIYVEGKVTKWNQLLASAKADKINIFTRSDACGAAEMWAQFLGSNQESLSGTGVFGDPGIADAVRGDKMGIGYNNIAYAYDIKSRKPFDGIKIIPLDIDHNGRIDAEENFYNSLDDLMKAIAEEKYPSPPARDLYLISKGLPSKKATVDFLNWILTDGQKFVYEAGYIQLKPEKVKEQIEKLSKYSKTEPLEVK
jgi:phosphate transport system substrate-binding protein